MKYSNPVHFLFQDLKIINQAINCAAVKRLLKKDEEEDVVPIKMNKKLQGLIAERREHAKEQLKSK